MRIHQLAAPFAGSRLAVGAFEKNVEVWDIASRARLAVYETVLDGGGDRLAISASGTHVAAAAYTRQGLVCYDAATGAELWRRKDLRRIQHVVFSASNARVYCGQDDRSLAIVDADSGDDAAQSLRGIREVWDSPFDLVQLRDPGRARRPHLVSATGQQIATFDRLSWALLDAAFAPGQVCISEPGGPVRCFDVVSGDERWRYAPRDGAHVLALSATSDCTTFQGVEYSFESGAEPNRFLRFAADGGAASEIGTSQRGYPVRAIGSGRWFVLHDGTCIDAVDGTLARAFPFGERGLPDA